MLFPYRNIMRNTTVKYITEKHTALKQRQKMPLSMYIIQLNIYILQPMQREVIRNMYIISADPVSLLHLKRIPQTHMHIIAHALMHRYRFRIIRTAERCLLFQDMIINTA